MHKNWLGQVYLQVKNKVNLTYVILVRFRKLLNFIATSDEKQQELSEDSNARLFKKLSQVCFIEYNNAYLYE
jgi:hypothetical protein